MPIHLPPISRRRFLASLLASTGSLATVNLTGAADSEPNPHLWALLADTHIAADPETISREVRMASHLSRTASELAAMPERPAGLLINGDCAYLKGEKADYAQLGDLLKPLRTAGYPLHLLLGNHDHRENLLEAMQAVLPAERPVASRLAALVPSPRANWFLLDSLDQTNVTPGLLGPDQLAWLTKALDANADRPAIVVGHHNLERGEPKSGLKDAAALFAVMEPRRHVKAYIYGHTHNWGTQQTESGLHCVNLPPVAYTFQAGKPSGHVLARLEPGSMKLELRCVNPQHALHGQKMELTWRPT